MSGRTVHRCKVWLGVRRALLAGAIGTLAAPWVAAQETPATEEIGRITITGSRLTRPDLSAPSPVSVVGGDQVRMAGNATVEIVLNESPQLAGGNTSSNNANGGSGVLTANLRALGAARTLVLVNGRRYAGANGDGSVDLATIPDALIERVEIMTGGASAVYGSDAIAGAVNFILRDDFEGIDFSYMHGATGESDGDTDKIDVVMGGNFADGRGNAVVYGSYTERKAVMMADREFSEVSLAESGGQFIPSGSSNIPGTRIGLSGPQLASLVGIDITNVPANCGTVTGIRFGENGVPLPYCSIADAYNFSPDNYLLRPLEREQIHGLASYELSPFAQAYTELHFVNTRNSFQQAPESGTLQTPGAGGALVVPNYATNPILSPATRQLFIDNPHIWDPDGDGTARVLQTGRRGAETGPRRYHFERDAYSFTVGLRGQFGDDANPWNWDVFYQSQRSRTDETRQGQYSLTRVGLGLDVVVDPVSGEVSCRNAILGCVPVNPFGLGAITPEAGAFIATQRTSREIFERTVAGVSLTGEPFKLPAGPVAIAIGAEYRDDSYDFMPGATDLAGEYGPTSRRPTVGAYDVTEFFGEVRVPILAGLPGIDSLALEGAVRRGDYSNFGEATTWKAALEWAPVEWLRIRAAHNRAMRAPTLNELFSPRTIGFTTGDDPCDVDFNPSAAVQQLCIEQGVAPADIPTFQQINVGFSQESGGNPNLQEEESETNTYGLVVSPPFLKGLNLTVDYFEITVEDAIESIGPQQTVNTCFALLNNNSAPCQAIVRDSSGQIDFVRASLNNIGRAEVNGVDVVIDYAFDAPALGLPGHDSRISVVAASSWLFERTNQVIGAAPRDCAGYVGGGCTGQTVYGVPDLKASLGVTWSSGPAMARIQARHIGDMKLFPGAVSIVSKVSGVTYLDFAGSVQILDGTLELFGGVDNVLDKQPPILGFSLGGDSNTEVSIYDVIGRRYFLGLRARF